jgi:hypothetical protein
LSIGASAICLVAIGAPAVNQRRAGFTRLFSASGYRPAAGETRPTLTGTNNQVRPKRTFLALLSAFTSQ